MTTSPKTARHAKTDSHSLPSRTIHHPPSMLTLAVMNAAIETGEVSSPLFREDLMRCRARWWELTRDLR
jgi:hypothetical protein